MTRNSKFLIVTREAKKHFELMIAIKFYRFSPNRKEDNDCLFLKGNNNISQKIRVQPGYIFILVILVL